MNNKVKYSLIGESALVLLTIVLSFISTIIASIVFLCAIALLIYMYKDYDKKYKIIMLSCVILAFIFLCIPHNKNTSDKTSTGSGATSSVATATSQPKTTSKSSKSKSKVTPAPTSPIKSHIEVDAQKCTYTDKLCAGTYVVGVDIPLGNYTITCIKGSGTVKCGTSKAVTLDSKNNKELDNINLIFENILDIEGNITLKVFCSNGSTVMVHRSTNGQGTVLKDGTYNIGTDVKIGTYIIECISGKGTVTATNKNSYVDNLNIKMKTKSTGDYINIFSGADFTTKNSKITVSGCKIKLIPLEDRFAFEFAG